MSDDEATPDDPARWVDDAGAPPGAAELVRALERPPTMPPDVRAEVRAAALRRRHPPVVRWVSGTALTALLVGGLVLWVLGHERPRHDERAPVTPAVEPERVGAPYVPVTPEPDAVVDPELRRQLAALGYVGAPRDAGVPDAGHRRRHARSVDAGAPVVTGPDGLLDVVSTPWSRVVLDGRDLGITPIIGAHVAPGLHGLEFITPDGARTTTSVRVPAGERVRLVRRL